MIHRSVLRWRHRRQRHVAQPQVACGRLVWMILSNTSSGVAADGAKVRVAAALHTTMSIRPISRCWHRQVPAARPCVLRDRRVRAHVPPAAVISRRGCLQLSGLRLEMTTARAVSASCIAIALPITAARAGDEGHLARQVEHTHVLRSSPADCRACCRQHQRLANCARVYSSTRVRS